MSKPKTMHVRPLTTDVGRGPERHRLRYKRTHGWWELPAAGAKVPALGREGNFWRRRMAEGACESYTPQPKAAPAPKRKDGE